MTDVSERIQSLCELREYINQTICYHEELEINAFHMTERILLRRGQPCGIFFCVHGPRLVKFSAIWETETNTILFYSSTGERYLRIKLRHRPALARAA